MTLEQLVTATAAAYTAQAGDATTWMSFGLLAAAKTIPVEVPFDKVVDFINAVGTTAMGAGLVDVQFALAKRTSKAPEDLEAIFGIVIDVDRPTQDILQEIADAGVPVPTFAFASVNGFKTAYVANAPIPLDVFTQHAMALTLAFEGGDAHSWTPSQMQRVPTCLKSLGDGSVVPVNFVAALMNASPFVPDASAVSLPARVLRALGAGALEPANRAEIRDYLEELGMDVPDEAGSTLNDVCPLKGHSGKKAYVNVDDDGAISVHCLGGHDGGGPKHWDETHLAELAGMATGSNAIKRFDPMRHLPVTQASVEYITYRLREWSTQHVTAVLELWQQSSARDEAAALTKGSGVSVSCEQFASVYQDRLAGVHRLPPMVPYYERSAAKLVHDDPSGRSLAVTSSRGPNLKTNALELKSTGMWTVVVLKDKKGHVEIVASWCADAPSMLDKLAAGHPDVLARLGVAAAMTYSLPVAHVTESWAINPRSFYIEAITVRMTLDDIAEVDAVEFFLTLFRAGRLPLATEEDVKRLVMAIASPLLRHIAPGQLGVYWFVASPGAGKDFLAELPRRIWEAVASAFTRVSFDVSLAGELEGKRMVEMAAGCIYARAKEAGKRPGMAELLIRFAGTDVLPGRGLYEKEVPVANTFTYIAESAEDLPDRREISRRTTVINVAFMSDKVSKGEVLTEILKNAPGIVKNLKRIVESKPPEWFTNQCETGSRPLVPVALARLLGATLPAVEGQDLTDVFEAMVQYIDDDRGEEEGRARLAAMEKRGDKSSLESQTLESYRFAHFIEVAAAFPGNGELFSPYARKSRELVNRLIRETDYRDQVKASGYMPITIGETKYAFRIEEGGRQFILCAELVFTNKMKDARAKHAAGKPPVPVKNIKQPQQSVSGDLSEPVFVASDADLLKKGAP